MTTFGVEYIAANPFLVPIFAIALVSAVMLAVLSAMDDSLFIGGLIMGAVATGAGLMYFNQDHDEKNVAALEQHYDATLLVDARLYDNDLVMVETSDGTIVEARVRITDDRIALFTEDDDNTLRELDAPATEDRP